MVLLSTVKVTMLGQFDRKERFLANLLHSLWKQRE
jgi:hypothetical protein